MNFGTIDLIARTVLAQSETPAPPTPQSPFGSPIFFILMLLFFMYFFVMRPQQKRERQRRLMLSALGKGDTVITSGGIKGTVVGLSESSVVLRVDDNTKIEFIRQAVSQVLPKDAEAKQQD